MRDDRDLGDRDVELEVLRAIQLKGSATGTLVSQACGRDVGALLVTLVESRLVNQARDRYLLSPAGRERIGQLLDGERAQVPHADLAAVYQRFLLANRQAKAVITAWQLRGDGSINDHSDPSYDTAAIERLAGMHANVASLLSEIGSVWPRLGRYRDRLGHAMDSILGGDTTMILHPLNDSYHQVWFELHEELIRLLSLSRADEAQSEMAD